MIPSETGVSEAGRLISVVVPTYKSAQFVGELVSRLLAVFASIEEACEIILVNDASPDNTWNKLLELKAAHPDTVRIVRLLKNSGQHNAILCGMHFAKGDVVITMDDDLQHPPEEIPKLINKLDSGYDLVIGAYNEKRHSIYRNWSGQLVDAVIRYAYRLPRSMKLTSFRAMRRAIVDVARRAQDPYPYITCILLDQATRVTNIIVRHEERPRGTSSYSMMRSVVLAANLLFGYSSLPLYMTAVFCGIASVLAVMILGWVLTEYLANNISVPGWASVMVLLTLFSAFILASSFVTGIYVARIHHQLSGRRVPFTVEEDL